MNTFFQKPTVSAIFAFSKSLATIVFTGLLAKCLKKFGVVKTLKFQQRTFIKCFTYIRKFGYIKYVSKTNL